jgi:hypothetical protein
MKNDAAVTALSALLLAVGGPVAGQDAEARRPRVGPAVRPLVVNIDLRTLPKVRAWKPGEPVRYVPRRRPPVTGPWQVPAQGRFADPVEQRSPGASRTLVGGLNFPGIEATGFVPPDTVGDVGPNHYVQMVNSVFSIFNKSGTQLAGPSTINSIFAGAGPPCSTTDDGDPVVVHDPIADRWLLSQFVFADPPHECIAVSQTADPVAGGFFAYDFVTPDFPDYPKIAVWPDGYYMGANATTAVYAFDRFAMLAGTPATYVSFTPAPVGAHSMMQPSDLDGSRPPPAGAPNYFYRHIDGDMFGGSDRLEIFEFHADFATPANSTFTGPTTLTPAPFVTLCPNPPADPNPISFDCITQKDTGQRVDAVGEWPMWRLDYRNFGTHETLLINNAVNVDSGGNQAGVRWYEMRKSGGGAWTIFQEGTYAPDSHNRWMGSIAMDFMGDIGLGYSVSSTSLYPSIRYTGRQDGDTAGLMTETEATLVAGGGSETGYNRWGDYSAMSVDPVDDCTFWFTSEYYPTSSAGGWQTRIGSFRFPLCGDLIFRDGFESGDILAWAPLSETDGGDLSATGAAALGGTATGLQAVVDDTNPLYVRDDSPNDESRYRARFYFDPNGFDPGESQNHRRTRIFVAFDGSPVRRHVALVLRRVSGQFSVSGRVRIDDNSQVDSPFFDVTDAPHFFELDWKRATSAVAADGTFELWIDDVSMAQLTGLTNFVRTVDLARLGPQSLKGGAGGTMYFDQFESRRISFIGPQP